MWWKLYSSNYQQLIIRYTSPITGMDTRWRNEGDHNYPYTGKDKTSGSQMNPCKTCETFEDEYMKHANKGR